MSTWITFIHQLITTQTLYLQQVADRLHDEEIEMLNDAKQEIVHSSHDPATAAKLRKQAFEVQLAVHEFQMVCGYYNTN